MSGITLDEYRKLKNEGRVGWDTNALNQHMEKISTFLNTAGEKDYSVDERADVSRSAEYIRAYANSRRGEADYDGLQEQVGNIIRGINSANSYYEQKKQASFRFKGDMNVPTAAQSEKNKLIEKYETALKKYYETQGETNSPARVLGAGTPVDAAANALKEVEKNPIIQEYKREKQLKDTATTDTVPTKEQAEQYRADAAALRKTGYESKYGEFDYDKLIQAAQGEQNPELKQWLRSKADEKASSEQLQGELDEIESRKKQLDEEKTGLQGQLEKASSVAEKQRLSSLIADIDDKHDSENARGHELNSLLPQRKQEESDNKLGELLESDPEAYDIAKNYWYWDQYKALRMDGGHKSSRDARVIDYVNNAGVEEFKGIENEFNALSQKGYDTKKLKNYISKVMTEADNEIEYGELKQQAKNNPVLASVRSVGENVVGALPDASQYITALINGDYINPKDTHVSKAQALRKAVSEDMNGFGKFLYQTGMSMADFMSVAALSAVPGGQAVGMTMLSTSAGVSAANEVIENGGDVGHAVATGIAAGIAEAVFERISLEQLKAFKAEKPDSVKAIVKNTLKGMFTEGSEEFFTDIANAITDGIINGDMSSLSLRRKSYIEQGMSASEAWKKTAADFAAQLGESFAGGALSGGIMGGGVSALSYADQKTADTRLAHKIGKEAQKSEGFDVEQLLEDAENSGSEKAASIAKYVRKDIENGKKPKKTDIGNIYQAISEYRRQENGGLEAEKKELVNEYDESGTEKLSDQETVSEQEDKPKSYAFGKTFAKGLPVTTSDGKNVGVVRIESSAPDYGQNDRTVVLKTKDGKYINADDVEATQPFYKTLFNRAKNYDTMGARGLVSQFTYYQEHMREIGGEVNVDKYHRAFEKLYELGKSGVKWENVANNKYYSREIEYLGATAASGAVVTGNNDVNVNLMHEQNKAQRIRIPGMRTSAESKLIVDPDNQTEIKASDEQLELLNAVATKIGRNIVLTDRFDENGMYADGVVYVNSSVDERYMTSIAIHEATHGIRETSPMEYKALQDFVSNYLVEKGESFETMIDDIEARWGDKAASYESKLEEVVCQTVMAIAADENALKTALDAPGNSSLLENVAAAIKKLAQRVMDFVKGQRNRQAQPWLGDVKALNELAERFSAAADADKASRYKQETKQGENTEQETETKKEQKNNAAEGVKTKYAIKDDIYGNKFVDVDPTIIKKNEARNIPDNDIRYAIDDELTDGFFDIGEDLFDTDRSGELENLVKLNPEAAVSAIYNSAAKTAQRVLSESRSIKISDEDYLKLARRVMKNYDISAKLNPGIDKELADKVKSFVEDSTRGSDFHAVLDMLAQECKDMILLSGHYDEDTLRDMRENVLSFVKNKTLLVTEYQADQIRENYGSLSKYRSKLGKMRVALETNAKNGGVYIEELIADIGEQYPELVATEPDSLSGFEWLDNLLNNVIAPHYVNEYADCIRESVSEAAIEMTFDITTELAGAKAWAIARDNKAKQSKIKELTDAKKVADNQRNAVLKAKVERLARKNMQMRQFNMERVKKFREELAQTKANDKDKIEKLKAKIAVLEDERSDLKGIILSDNRTFRQNYIEERDKSNSIRQIGKMLDRMTKKLDGKTNNSEYIPENLKQPILDVLKLFKAEKQNKDGTTRALPAYFGEFRNLDDVGERVQALAAEYAKLENPKAKSTIGFDINSLGFDYAVKETLNELAEYVKGKNVYNMSAEELRAVLETMRDLETVLRKSVEIIVDNKLTTIKEAGEKAATETEAALYKKGDKNSIFGTIWDSLLSSSLDPLRYGRLLSGYNEDNVMYKLMSDLHRGDKDRVRIMQQAYMRILKTTSEFDNKQLRDIQRKDVESFKFKDLDTGKRVKVSKGMLLSIYLTSRQAAGYRHLVNEKANHYTKIPDLDLLNRNETTPDFRSNHAKARGEFSHKIRLSKEDLRQITEFVQQDDLMNEIAKAVSDVFNGVLKDEINKVSMQKYGRLMATVEEYFPLKVDDNDPQKKYQSNVDGDNIFVNQKIKSRSFTKQRTYSEAAIVIDDVLNVFTRHVNETAEYCGFLVPVENIKKVLNSGTDTLLVREAIEKKFGSTATHYMSKLLGDIQVRKDFIDNTWIDKLSGQIMGSVLMVNPGAALKNVAAFPLAYKYFGANNVNAAAIKGLVEHKKMNALIEKYGEYTPYMWYREQGNGTVVGELSKQAGIYSKWTDKFDLMGKMDRYVVNSLLFAAEQHVKQTTNLKVDSEEFCQEVARQFEKAVDESQPNNMITSKPQFIRNNTLRLLSMNAFKSQNLAMGNGILDSFMEFKTRAAEYKANATEEAKAAKNAAAKKFVSHLLGVAASSMIYSALGIASTILIYHRPDDYKDEEGNISVEEILKKWGLGSVESFLGAFVGLEEIYSTISTLIDENSYYSNNMGNMALSGVSELVKYCKNGNYSKAWGKIADLLGIPLAFGTNVQRLLDSASRYANDIAHGRAFITNNKGEIDTSGFAYAIVSSVESGDKENAEWIERTWTEKLKGSGKNGEEANKYIKGKIAETLALKDEDVEKAALAKQNGDYAEYERLLNAVAGKGFDPADVKKAAEKVLKNVAKDLQERGLSGDSAKEDLKDQGFNDKGVDALMNEVFEDTEEPEEEAKEEETEYSAFSDTTDGGVAYDMNDAFDALVSGDKAGYEQISNYLVNEGGVEEKKLSSSMRSATRTDELWKQYYTAFYAHDEQTRIELKKTLETIYGSWQAAAKKGEAYWKRKGNKEVKH